MPFFKRSEPKNQSKSTKPQEFEQDEDLSDVELDEEDLKQLEEDHVALPKQKKKSTVQEEEIDISKIMNDVGKVLEETEFDVEIDDHELEGELIDIENEDRDWESEVKELEDKVAGMGRKAVELKRSGEKELAIAAMKEYKVLKEELEVLKVKKEEFEKKKLEIDEEEVELHANSFDGGEEKRDFDAEIAAFEARVKKAANDAVQFKKSGNKEKALQAMKIYKSLKEQFDEFKEEVEMLRSSSPSKDPEMQSANEFGAEVEDDDVTSESTLKKLELLDQRIKEYSIQAVELKKIGQTDMAKKLLVEIKSMKENRELVEFGDAENYSIPAAIGVRSEFKLTSASPPPVSKSDVKVEAKAESKLDVVKIPKPLTGVQAKLEYQAILDRLSRQLQDIESEISTLKQSSEGSAKSDIDSIKRRLKELISVKAKNLKDLDMVNAALKQGLPPPSYHIEHTEVQRELFFPDIKKNEMIVFVKEGRDFKPPDGWNISSSILSIELNLSSLEKQSKSSSTFDNTNNPRFNFKCSFNLPPANKIGRGFKLARLEIKVTCPRFLLFAPTLLGECDFKIGDLTDKCELSSMLTLKRKGRPVGQLDVVVQIRQPFKGKDIRPVQTDILVIDHFYDNAECRPLLEPSVETKIEDIQKRRSRGSNNGAEAKEDSKISNDKDSSTNNSTMEEPSGECPPEIDSGDWKAPQNLNLFVSNDVLTSEMDNLAKEIATLRAKKENVDTRLQVRYEKCQLKIALLQKDVESGVLTLPLYIDNLKKSVEYHTKLVRALKNAGRKDDAKQVLLRIKIMNQEIGSADSASAEQS